MEMAEGKGSTGGVCGAACGVRAVPYAVAFPAFDRHRADHLVTRERLLALSRLTGRATQLTGVL